MILAPLRGVTTRCFREVFAAEISAAGFTEAVTPFISATRGLDPLKDRELATAAGAKGAFSTTPQFIGKDPDALRAALLRIKSAGWEYADLNCGCPFPMVRNKGRGSGLLRAPDTLRKMLEVGCEIMGDGKFSVKTRIGIDRADELLELVPTINAFPLRRVAVHPRTAKQMYGGEVDMAAFAAVAAAAKIPVVFNGDAPFPPEGMPPHGAADTMIGRAFIRHLGDREDAAQLLERYISASLEELCAERPVLGRMKELVAYWKELPRWKRRWPALKISRTLEEFRSVA